MQEYHDDPNAGRPGTEKTTRCIRRQFTWPTLANDVRNHIKQCLICTTAKTGIRQPRMSLRAYVPRKPWPTIAIDSMGLYKITPDRNRFIFVVTDTFSKWTEAFACRTASSRTTISLLEDQVFSRWRYPQAIISDNIPSASKTR